MILGLICGLGTTKLAALSFALIIIYLVFQRKRVVVPWELWTIVGILELTEIWSVQPGKATYESCAILCAWLSWKVLPRKGFTWGISLIALTQVAWISYQYLKGISRPWGLSRNASVVGLSGMWGLPLLSMNILGGMSLSRTAIVGSLILATRSRMHVLSAIILIVLSLGIGLIVTPDRYFSLHEISEAAQLRIDAANGTDTRTLDIPLQEVRWLPYGYGFGQYYFRTGHIQPHNIIIRTWYELGLFSIPVFGILLWLWWKWGKDWRLLACALVTGMLTDELLGSVEGIYMILTYAILTETFPTSGLLSGVNWNWPLRQKSSLQRNTKSEQKLITTRMKLHVNVWSGSRLRLPRWKLSLRPRNVQTLTQRWRDLQGN